jgi:predicted acylesterase/phospholipase RssA
VVTQPDDPNRESKCPDPPRVAPVDNLVGLALSGGGIRSATFNLGVLQGLASRNALWIFDYLSTVSGGGFVGSWWSAWLSREKRWPGDIFPASEELEPQRRRKTALLFRGQDGRTPVPSLPDGSLIARKQDPIHFVRLFSNYLTPRTGAFSPDTWRLIAFMVRNLLFTWVALLPLLLAAVMAGQAFFLTDSTVAQDFLSGGSGTARWQYLATPFRLLVAAHLTLALLWLAHSSARLSLALASFVVLGIVILGLRSLMPASGGPSLVDGWVIAVVVATIAWHVGHALLDYERTRTNGGARPVDGTVRATPADHRGWLTRQQATLLEIGTFGGLLLLFAGFGHDVVRFVFVETARQTPQYVAKAGGWGAALAAIGSAAYTAFKSVSSSNGTAPAPPRGVGKAVVTIAPFLVVFGLTLLFAYLSHALLSATIAREGPNLVPMLAKAVLSLALLEVLFAIYESTQDPPTPADEGSFSWRSFVPSFVLRLIGKDPAIQRGEPRAWYYLFSPRGWARIFAGGALVAVLIFAGSHSSFSLGAAIRWAMSAPRRSVVAIGILVLTGLISLVKRTWPVALGSARPAGLLAVACIGAALSLIADANSELASAAAANMSNDPPLLVALLWIALLVGGVVGIGWLVDPNLLSMHGFYKARLTRAYLGASNTARNNDEITDSAPGDDLDLTGLWNHDAGAPYHVINTTLNLVGSADLAMSQRSAENFVMSRYHCGSARAGYRCTADYMDGALSLGTAAAISGAAVSPTMGSSTPSAALALLLSLLNVRLGFWAPTPSGRRWRESHARLWPFYLLRETLSNTGHMGMYCYLTDGGHFDNTGLYALIERGCRYIVLCDCGADPAQGFEDLGNAIRRCRIDFGTEIALSIDRFTARSHDTATARTHVVPGTITYQDEHLEMLGVDAARRPTQRYGTILWIKPSVTAVSAADVRQYSRAHGDFPQQTTADQWYDESQFESYRRLGYESAQDAFAMSADALDPRLVEGDFASIETWFQAQVP